MKKWRVLKISPMKSGKGNNLWLQNVENAEEKLGLDIWGEPKGIVIGTTFTVLADKIKARDYNGKKYYSAQIGDLNIDKAVSPVTTPITPKVWDAKDRRIVRQNALSHATALVCAVGGLTLGEIDEYASLICKLAEKFEIFVYRNGCEPTLQQDLTERLGDIPLDPPKPVANQNPDWTIEAENEVEDIPFE